MASILLTSTPVRGHVTPLLSIAQSLVGAGDRVRFLTGERYRDEVVGTGADFLPLPPEADYDDRDIDAAFPGRRGLRGPAGVRYDMIEIFLRPVPAQLSAVRAALAAEPTDVILAESMFAAAAVLTGVPREQRPLVVNLGIVPLAVKHPDVAPFGLGIPPRPGMVGRLRNRLLSVGAEQVVFRPIQRYANEIARSEIGRDLPRFFLDWPAGADLLVQFTVPAFEYPRPGLADTVRFVGPVARSRPSATPLPDWWDDLTDDRPVVHVTQGTVANSDWALVEPAIRALADDDVVVVVSTGGRPLESLPTDLPGNVRAAPFLPYDRLLPMTDLFITNGGYGGVHYALEHGVPIIVAGRTEDKTEVSARVGWSGAGIDLRTDTPTAQQIAAAARRILSDERYRTKAAAIGQDIRRSPGPDAVHNLLVEALAASHTMRRTPVMNTASVTVGEIRDARDLDDLSGLLSGTLSQPVDPDWDESRRAWQLTVDQRPRAVVTACDARDIILTVRAAASLGLRVAAQNTGHNVSPLGDLTGTILVRTAALAEVEINSDTRVARVGAGARWGDLQAAATAKNLIGVGGFSYDVGVIGLILGGGLGWLSRSHGLASASVLGFDVVTADGVPRHLDEQHEPELFRAVLQGADLGVILAVDIQLYATVEMTAGALFWPGASTREVVRFWAGWTESLPDAVTSVVRLLRVPEAPGVPPFLAGREFVVIELVAQLPCAEVDMIVAPLRDMAPEIDTISLASPVELGALHMDPPHPSAALSASAVLHSLPTECADALVDVLGGDDGRGLTSVELRDLGGALDRGGRSAVAGARALMVAVAVAPPSGAGGAPGADALAAGRVGLDAVIRAVAPISAPRRLRSMTETRVNPRELWADDLTELQALKQQWDPANLVHANHSVVNAMR
ncbi:nucleotide disphospho-sugar-binding domain-containing protein [Dietzia alimentaria]|uniref:nucleotide disphospho-sugar-binding domain-containing protein n=1 Tax=Dietzia alimentaria TaxID=665550 RepID=UPI00029AB740|nr:FAD-binding protein [Dietzia alimentaria]